MMRIELTRMTILRPITSLRLRKKKQVREFTIRQRLFPVSRTKRSSQYSRWSLVQLSYLNWIWLVAEAQASSSEQWLHSPNFPFNLVKLRVLAQEDGL